MITLVRRRHGVVAAIVTLIWSVLPALATAQAAAKTETAQGPAIYAPQSRADYIARALTALAAASDSDLIDTRNYLYVMDRNRCRAPTRTLKVDCLLAVARDSCAAKPSAEREMCELLSDVLVTNQLSTNTFLSRTERLKLRSHEGPYRHHLYRALNRRYASLVAELGMSPEFGEGAKHAPDEKKLASYVDQHCQAITAVRDVSWHYCAAAIVWFIATSDRTLEETP